MRHFLVIGNKNALFWKDNFPLYMEGRLHFGRNQVSRFILPNDAEEFDKICDGKKTAWLQGTGRWFTDMPVEHNVRRAYYSNGDFPRYDNFDAVNTDSIERIPDTDGLVGVPVGIVDIVDPRQFEVVGMLMNGNGKYDYGKPIIGGKMKYTRILIRRRK